MEGKVTRKGNDIEKMAGQERNVPFISFLSQMDTADRSRLSQIPEP